MAGRRIDQLGEPSRQREHPQVRRHDAFDAGFLDLQNDLVSVGQPGSMHLGNGSRRKGLRIHPVKQARGIFAQLLEQPLSHDPPRHRRRPVQAQLELLHVVPREDRWRTRYELAQLDIGRTEALEGLAQQRRRGRAPSHEPAHTGTGDHTGGLAYPGGTLQRQAQPAGE